MDSYSLNKSRRVDLFLSCRADSTFHRPNFIRELSHKFCKQLIATAVLRGACPSLFCPFLHAEEIRKRDVSLALMRLRIGGLGVCLITPDYFDAPTCSAEMQCLLEMRKEDHIDLCLFSLGWPAHQNLADDLKNRFSYFTGSVIIPLEMTSTASGSASLAGHVWNIWDSPVSAASSSGFRSYALGATRSGSFRRLLSVFTLDDLPEIRFYFGVQPECANVLTAFDIARHNRELEEIDVRPLRAVATQIRVGKEKKLMAIEEYKKKWIDTDGLEWGDDEERARFIRALEDAERQSVAGRSTFLGTRTRSETETQGDRYRVIHNVPRNPHYVQLSLETPDSYDSKLREKILSGGGDKAIFAVACGMGGVGKTCALRGIGRLPEIKSRFPGGTFFASIGGDGGLGRLIAVVADMVCESGGHERAKNIRSNNSLKYAIDEAGRWFENERCLFMLDDIWCVKGISEGDFERVACLAKHPESRVVISCRDINVALLGRWVKFERRVKDGREATRIILRCAGFSGPPSEPQARRSYNEILGACNGLPLMLAIVGRAVQAHVLRGCDENKAWTAYSRRISEKGIAGVFADDKDLKNFERSVELSVELLEEVYEYGNWREVVDTLCIARRQMPVPLHVFQRLWNTDAEGAEKVIEKLGNFCLVGISTEEKGSAEETVVLVHDEIISYVRRRTGWCGGRRGKREEICHNLMQSYLPSDGTRACFADSVQQVVDDGYIFENIFHLLRESGSVERAMELISDPRWVVEEMVRDGAGKISGDVELCISMLETRRNILSESEGEMAMQFCRALQIACYGCAYDNRGCAGGWRYWFELYGRLLWLEKNVYVRRFLEGIEGWAPRPWLRPSRGVLPGAGSSLKHVITVPADCEMLCEQMDSGGVLVCYKNRKTGKLYTKRFQFDDATETDPVEFPYRGALDDICCAQLLGEGKMILGMRNGDVQMYDCVSHMGHAEGLTESVAWMARVSVSPDGKRIVTGSDENSVRILEHDGRRWRSEVLTGHTERIKCVGISSDGRRIVTGSYDKSVRVWEHEGSGWRSEVLLGHSNYVTSVSISLDGRRIVSGSLDKTVWVWEHDGSGWRGKALTGHTNYVNSVSISSDGKRLVSGGWDNSVRVWEQDGSGWRGEVVTRRTGRVNSVSMSSDGRRIMSGCYDNSVRVWEQDGRRWRRNVLTGHTNYVRSVSISSDGKRLVSGSRDNSVRVWEQDGRRWRSEVLSGHTDYVNRVSISSGGKRLVSGSRDKSVRVWEHDGRRWRSEDLTGHTRVVESLSISSNGKRIVSGGGDNSVRVWEHDGRRWRSDVLTGHTDYVRSVSISADGRRIVSGSWDDSVRIWKHDGRRWRSEVLTGHTSLVNSVSISSDGRRIVSGSDDNSVRVWERDGKRWRSEVLTGYTDDVNSVSILSEHNFAGMGVWYFDVEGELHFMDKVPWEDVTVAPGSTSSSLWRKDGRFSASVRNMLKDVCQRLGAVGGFVTASGICFKLKRAPFLVFIDVVFLNTASGTTNQ